MGRGVARSAGRMASQPDNFQKGLAFAVRVGVELVAALVVGLGLGYLADSYFKTQPVFIFIGVILGVSGGLLNLYRTVSRM